MAGEFSGKRLGDFDVGRELGRGGMGVVYEARQVSLNRRVALKILSASSALTPRAVDRFRREAEAAAKLHHTNIVPVYATGEQHGVHFYAMELVEGTSLDVVVRQVRSGGRSNDDSTPTSDLAPTGAFNESPTPLTTAADSSSGGDRRRYFDSVATMIADVADALEHAHANGVIHRDVKPSNLLLGPDGRLSVNDFGLARLLEQPGMTVTGEFVGTPAYMSPEQITAGRVPIDHRTDVYSLGATLYELLTLRPPFLADRRDQLLAMIVQKEPTAPRKIDPRIPVDLETICLKCLEKDPDRRYQSSKALADDLRRFVARFAIAAKRVGPIGRAAKWVRRNPWNATLALGLVIAVGVAGAIAYRAHQSELERVAADRAERRREIARNGMAEAMAGDRAALEKAIDEAIELDADAFDVRILRGFAASIAGRYREALDHFEEATRLRPQSVTAHSLLAVTYIYLSDWGQAQRARRELDGLPVESTDDLLFKGVAIGMLDATEGLPLIDQAMARKPIHLAYLYSTNIRSTLALETADLVQAERAIEDAATVRNLFRGRSHAINESVGACLCAAIACKTRGLLDRQHELLEKSAQFVRTLNDDFPDDASAVLTVCEWETFRAFDKGVKPSFPAQVSRVRRSSGDHGLRYFEALDHFLAGRDREALAALGDVYDVQGLDTLRLFVTLEVGGDGRDLEALLRRWKDSAHPDDGWRLFFGRLAGGDAEGAMRHMRKRMQAGYKLDPQTAGKQAAFENYFRSEDPDREARLLRDVAGFRRAEIYACFYLALRELGSGHRDQGKVWLERTVTLPYPYSACWHASVIFLDRLNHDSAWPHWPKIAKATD